MSKYIGDVSAYAYAVSKGYTGTEEEFAALMADYADVGQRAEDAAESALNSKTSAQTAAQTATTKASEASTSATSASGSASAASASASAASGSATSAANSATAASGSATSAAGSATTASTKANEASASATAAQTAQTAAEAAQTAAETAQGKAEDAQEAAEDAAESVSASAAQIATNAANIAQLKSDKADIIISTAEGAIATFEDGGDDMPMVSCVAKIEPVQEGSGDPSPENIRPISGWTGANVRAYGKNLFDKNSILTNTWIENMTGQTQSGATGYSTSDYMPVKGGTPIYIPTKGSSRGAFYDKRKNYISACATNGTYTIPAQDGYLRITCKDSDVDYNSYQIEYGTTPTSYEAYAGQSINIDWQSEAGTVYGGTLDVVSGVLTVDMARVDLGELTFSATNTANIFYAGISDMRAGYSTKIVCEAYKRYSAYYTGMPDKSVANNATYGYIYIKDTDYSDADTFMASLSGIYLAYEIKNPTTVQLTPTEVRTLLGLNNVWADTGDVEVQYRADTKLFIDGKRTDWAKLIAPTEATYKATRAYTSGSLLIVGNQLYKATTAIANGATLTVGTNITATTLAEVIAAL